MEMVSEDTLKHIAHIIGPYSAASKALNEIELRRSDGQDPVCVKHGSTFIVFDASEAGLQPST